MHDYNVIGATITSPGGNTLPDLRSWTQAAQPYIKSWPLLNDPALPDPLSVWTPGSAYWYYNWMRWPAFGMNVNYLNNAQGDCSQWAKLSPAMTAYGPPINNSAVTSPSETVFAVTTKRVGTAASGAYLSNTGESPAGYTASDACTWSNGGWGNGSFGDTANWYPGNPTGTGDFAARYTGGGIAVMCDSSAKHMQPGRIAQGTNWRVGIANTAVQINDRTKYLWDTAQ